MIVAILLKLFIQYTLSHEFECELISVTFIVFLRFSMYIF
jgi:hypothetical protein